METMIREMKGKIMFVVNLIRRLAGYTKTIMISGNGKCFRIAENDSMYLLVSGIWIYF